MNHNGRRPTASAGVRSRREPAFRSTARLSRQSSSPIRTGTVNNYQPVVSVLLGQLELVIRNGDGLLGVGRKGTDAPNLWSAYSFADGVKHIVSYVVQANGYFQVYVDGLSVWNYTASTADMTSITAQTWYATQINVGKGYNGDAWSSFNGDIADTFVYKTALSASKTESHWKQPGVRSSALPFRSTTP